MYSRFLKLALLFLFFFSIAKGESGGNFEEIFSARQNSIVRIKYLLQLEEDRVQLDGFGVAYDPSGVVMLPPGMINSNYNLKELKDFKVFVRGGDEEGYEAEYLGKSNFFEFSFLKLKKPLPENLFTPITKFRKSKAKMGEEVWGMIVLDNFSDARMPKFSKVSGSLFFPMEVVNCSEVVGFAGSPVFDMEGGFLGVVVGTYASPFVMQVLDGKDTTFRVLLHSEILRDKFVSALEIPEIVRKVPENPFDNPPAWLGIVGINSLKRDVAKLMGLEGKSAFVISGIVESSPAEKAGLKKGDIIFGMNGKDFLKGDSADAAQEKFMFELGKFAPGDKITVRVAGGSAKNFKDVEVELGKTPKGYRECETRYFKKLGFSIREYLLDDAIMRASPKLGVDAAVVRYVKPNSPASSALPSHLEVGDKVVEINSRKVSGYAEAEKILSELSENPAAKEIVLVVEGISETKIVKINLN